MKCRPIQRSDFAVHRGDESSRITCRSHGEMIDEGVRPFVFALRQYLGLAYYSVPAVKKTFAYTGPPQPDGFADFQDRPA